MLFNPETCERLHNRNISVTTYVYEPDAIALEGRLTDDRFVTTYSLLDELRPAGIVHDMVIRMIVRGPKLIIEAVEVQMLTVPHTDCPQVENSLQPLIGEPITAGFTAKVHQLVGGGQGCAHLVALCRAMASAAIQGAYSMMAQKPTKERRSTMQSLKNIIDTCHLWRSDGPLVQNLKKKLKKGH